MIGNKLAATFVAVVTGFSTFALAPGATADQVWTQSFGRSGPDAPCVTPAELDIEWQSSWGGSPEWSPSWEQWANDGEGGWTCTRQIVWARTALPKNCVFLLAYSNSFPDSDGAGLVAWLDFGTQEFLGAGSVGYSDSLCTNVLTYRGGDALLGTPVALVTDGNADTATRICADGGIPGSTPTPLEDLYNVNPSWFDGYNPNIWLCTLLT